MSLNYESRKQIIWNSVLKKMMQIYNPPRHLQPDNMKEGRTAYLEALFEAVNSQLSNDMQKEDFIYYCEAIAKDLIQQATVRVWFMPNDVRKCALKHGQVWIGKQSHLASYENPNKPKEKSVDKSNPEEMGWSLSSIENHRRNLQEAIDNNELQGTLAQSFRQILDSAESKILARKETPY